jgi:hypothetical protein
VLTGAWGERREDVEAGASTYGTATDRRPRVTPPAEQEASQYQVGVYYFPNYHVDPRNEEVHGPGWTEWELVKLARPRFEGHRQPRVPAWGYLDEADPDVMAMKIDAAADHGIDYWIFDWYWYNDGPFLNRCLEEGYLRAGNNERVRFCCMWANHDWLNIHPAKLRDSRSVLYPGAVTRETFDTMADRVIQTYFRHPSHFTIAGCPYFSIYELSKLLQSFGGIEPTCEALDGFRAKTKAAGFRDLHLNAVVWGRPVLPGEQTPINPQELVEALGFDSFTSYVWIHHVPLGQFPETDYNHVRDRYFDYWEQVEQSFSVPYFPNVTMGWDSSPRTIQSDRYLNAGYPFMATIGNNTPDRFHEALSLVKQGLDERDGPSILNINAWNEWTEGSYLEPDMTHGTRYLEAIRDVFR